MTTMQTKRLSGAQWKKLIKAKKMKEGTWTVEKPTGKTPSSQDMGLLDGDWTCRFCGSETETAHHIVVVRRWLVNVISSLENCLLNQRIKAWPY
jgi:hypothetical protein